MLSFLSFFLSLFLFAQDHGIINRFLSDLYCKYIAPKSENHGPKGLHLKSRSDFSKSVNDPHTKDWKTYISTTGTSFTSVAHCRASAAKLLCHFHLKRQTEGTSFLPVATKTHSHEAGVGMWTWPQMGPAQMIANNCQKSKKQDLTVIHSAI